MARIFVPSGVCESLFVATSHAFSSGFLQSVHESGVLLFSREGNKWSVVGFMKIPFKEGENKQAFARNFFGDRPGIVLGEYLHTREAPIPNQVEFFFYNP